MVFRSRVKMARFSVAAQARMRGSGVFPSPTSCTRSTSTPGKCWRSPSVMERGTSSSLSSGSIRAGPAGQETRLDLVEGELHGLNLPLPASGVFGPVLQIGVELFLVPMVVGQGSIHIGDRQTVQLLHDLLRGHAA